MQKIPFETLQGLTFGTSYAKIADDLLYFSRFSENKRKDMQPNAYYETTPYHGCLRYKADALAGQPEKIMK